MDTLNDIFSFFDLPISVIIAVGLCVGFALNWLKRKCACTLIRFKL